MNKEEIANFILQYAAKFNHIDVVNGNVLNLLLEKLGTLVNYFPWNSSKEMLYEDQIKTPLQEVLLSAITVYKIISLQDVERYELAATILEQLYTHEPICCPFRNISRVILGIKMKMLLEMLRRNEKHILPALNKHLPPGGFLFFSEDQKALDDMNNRAKNFWKFLLSLVVDSKSRREYFEQDYEGEFGEAYGASITKLTKKVLSQIISFLPPCPLEVLLSGTKPAPECLKTSDGGKILLEFIKGKQTLDRDTLMELLKLLKDYDELPESARMKLLSCVGYERGKANKPEQDEGKCGLTYSPSTSSKLTHDNMNLEVGTKAVDTNPVSMKNSWPAVKKLCKKQKNKAESSSNGSQDVFTKNCSQVDLNEEDCRKSIREDSNLQKFKAKKGDGKFKEPKYVTISKLKNSDNSKVEKFMDVTAQNKRNHNLRSSKQPNKTADKQFMNKTDEQSMNKTIDKQFINKTTNKQFMKKTSDKQVMKEIGEHLKNKTTDKQFMNKCTYKQFMNKTTEKHFSPAELYSRYSCENMNKERKEDELGNLLEYNEEKRPFIPLYKTYGSGESICRCTSSFTPKIFYSKSVSRFAKRNPNRLEKSAGNDDQRERINLSMTQQHVSNYLSSNSLKHVQRQKTLDKFQTDAAFYKNKCKADIDMNSPRVLRKRKPVYNDENYNDILSENESFSNCSLKPTRILRPRKSKLKYDYDKMRASESDSSGIQSNRNFRQKTAMLNIEDNDEMSVSESLSSRNIGSETKRKLMQRTAELNEEKNDGIIISEDDSHNDLHFDTRNRFCSSGFGLETNRVLRVLRPRNGTRIDYAEENEEMDLSEDDTSNLGLRFNSRHRTALRNYNELTERKFSWRSRKVKSSTDNYRKSLSAHEMLNVLDVQKNMKCMDRMKKKAFQIKQRCTNNETVLKSEEKVTPAPLSEYGKMSPLIKIQKWQAENAKHWQKEVCVDNNNNNNDNAADTVRENHGIMLKSNGKCVQNISFKYQDDRYQKLIDENNCEDGDITVLESRTKEWIFQDKFSNSLSALPYANDNYTSKENQSTGLCLFRLDREVALHGKKIGNIPVLEASSDITSIVDPSVRSIEIENIDLDMFLEDDMMFEDSRFIREVPDLKVFLS